LSETELRVSVIVTTYNRPAKLRCLLEALARQTLPRETFEVVVVDDGSPEPLEPVVKSFGQRLQVVLHRQANSGPAIGRNTALSLARSRLVAMTDDDCEPAPDWLEMLLGELEKNPEAMVGGHTINGLPENLYSTVSQMIVDRVYEAHNRDRLRARFFTTSNLALSKEALEKLGGFDARYRYAGGEDRGLSDRWRHSGRRMIYLPQARVHHFHNLTLRGFLRQHFNYGRGAIVYHRTRLSSHAEEVATAREIVFNGRAWRDAIRAQADRHSAARIAVLLVLWQVANAAGYFWELAVRGTRFSATEQRHGQKTPPKNRGV
jgi:glycosyltransferase involved in cell wall biosynthesis